jgi:hypothetical protein
MLPPDLNATIMQKLCITLQLQKTVTIIPVHKFKNMNHPMNFLQNWMVKAVVI